MDKPLTLPPSNAITPEEWQRPPPRTSVDRGISHGEPTTARNGRTAPGNRQSQLADFLATALARPPQAAVSQGTIGAATQTWRATGASRASSELG